MQGVNGRNNRMNGQSEGINVSMLSISKQTKLYVEKLRA
jgi:hypothetical protein